MIPALKKQIDLANERETGWSQEPFSELPVLSVENAVWPHKRSVGLRPHFPKNQQQISSYKIVAEQPKGEKGDDPVGGPHRSWYGNYTGPGNERSDWEEEHLPSMTPLDRGPMQHDQEYSNFEERYGYGSYEVGPDGKSRWKGEEGSFWKMRLDTEHPFLHTSLIESDARLMWRSAWYPVEGLANGGYDLTFSKGTRGVTNLITDSLAAGVIHGVFPVLMGVDAAFFGIAASRNALDDVFAGGGMPAIRRGVDSWGHFSSAMISSLPSMSEATFRLPDWPSRPFGISGVTVGRYVGMAVGAWLGLAYGIGFGAMAGAGIGLTFGGLAGVIPGAIVGAVIGGIIGVSAGIYVGGRLGETIGGGMPSIRRGLESWGGDLSRASGGVVHGAKHAGGQISDSWKHAGALANVSWKSAGGKVSNWSKDVGGGIASGAKSAGGKVSDTWKKASGGSGGGGCFLTTAAVRSLSIETGERVLGALRAFRDDVLLVSDQGRELVGAYYAIAPQIVDRIDASSDVASEYERIYRAIVLPCHQFILREDYEAAIGIYSRGVCDLAAKWLSDGPKVSKSPFLSARQTFSDNSKPRPGG